MSAHLIRLPNGSDAQTTLHKTLRTANRVKVLSLLPFPKIVSPVISSALLPHPLPSGCFVRKARVVLEN